MQGARALHKCISVAVTYVLLSGCVGPRFAAVAKLEKTSQVVLPAGLSETSGLYCQTDNFLTINDSGNLPLIHTLDETGNLVISQRVRHPNTDWEAITVVDNTLVVADIGNNRGKRTDLSLIPVALDSGATMTAKPIGYQANNITTNRPYAHDFDAEAMTVADGAIYLFSKSWATHIAQVYRFRLDDDLSSMTPYASIAGLPGVITGADWDKNRQQFVVIGYLSDPFGNFDAFIARLDSGFTVMDVWQLPEFRQVEGICVSTNGQYWITQEAGDNGPAVLASFRLIDE